MSFAIQLLLGLSLMACSNPTPKKQQLPTNSQQPSAKSDTIKTIPPKPIPSFELYADSLNNLGDSVAIEVFSISWEADDLLCDQYSGSEGPMEYTIYRIAKSKKIIMETQSGAYCQGDSDFNDMCLYDLQGYYLYATHWGVYVPQSASFYNQGKCTAIFQKPGEGEELYAPRVVPGDDNVNEAPKNNEPLENMRERVITRKKGLEKILDTLTNTKAREEATATLESVNRLLADPFEWKSGFVLRKARKGEETMVSRFEVNVYASPKKSAKEHDKISYYDGYFTVHEISADGKWCKLKGMHELTGKEVEGWIEKKCLVPGIFSIKRD